MQNDETQVQDDTLQEETSEEETVEEETTKSDEADESQDWEAEAKKWKAIAERNKKKAAEAPKKVAKQDTSNETVEETVLRAQGMDDELVTHLKKVAKLNGTTLLAAQADPLFTQFKDNFEQEKRVAEAQVGASGGSGERQAPRDFTTPGLSKDEHKKMTQEALKNLRV